VQSRFSQQRTVPVCGHGSGAGLRGGAREP